MLGYRFSRYTPPPEQAKSDFEKLLKIFMQLILVTSGNVAEALQWLTEVDRQYGLTNDKYGIGDFIEDLKKNGYITEEGPKGEFKLNAKSEQRLRQSALEEIFGKLKKTNPVSIIPLIAGEGMNKQRNGGITNLVIRSNRFLLPIL